MLIYHTCVVEEYWLINQVVKRKGLPPKNASTYFFCLWQLTCPCSLNCLLIFQILEMTSWESKLVKARQETLGSLWKPLYDLAQLTKQTESV